MFPNHAGTGPVSSFPQRYSSSRLASPCNAAGMGPARPFSLRSSWVTRPAASVVTPNHSPSGTDVFQFVRFVQPAPPVAS